MSEWDGLTPPYRTIVADPPWWYAQGGPHSQQPLAKAIRAPRYSMMHPGEIKTLPVADLAGDHAHLFLWTTNKWLREAFDVAKAWGFRPSQTLVWCKPLKGIGPGGTFSNTAEFVLYCRRGRPENLGRVGRTWWEWPRGQHSVKPQAFLDVVEEVCPGPYVELFARAPRLGWDSWGYGYESQVAVSGEPTG